MEIQKDFDIVDIPLEGIAAYWLALKKLVGAKRNVKGILEGEAEYTTEPFVRFLLDVGFSDMDESLVRRLAEVKRDVLLDETGLKFDLMQVALIDTASGENPRRCLSRMTARFPRPPITEDKAFKMSQELLTLAKEKRAETASYFNVHHRSKLDQLLVVLLFYVMWSRHEGKMGLMALVEHIRSSFFAEGVTMVADNLEPAFVTERLSLAKEALLKETRLKMNMSLEMCMAIRNRLEYDDVFRVARAYML